MLVAGDIARCNRVERLLDMASRDDGSARAEDYSFGIIQAFVGSFDVKGVVGAVKGRPHIFFFHAEVGIRDATVTGVQTCALPISEGLVAPPSGGCSRAVSAEPGARGARPS